MLRCPVRIAVAYRPGITDGRATALAASLFDPNGSTAAAAGLCDASGRVFGLMPHPEAFPDPVNHPRWTRRMPARADGLLLLENGVQQAAAA